MTELPDDASLDALEAELTALAAASPTPPLREGLREQVLAAATAPITLPLAPPSSVGAWLRRAAALLVFPALWIANGWVESAHHDRLAVLCPDRAIIVRVGEPMLPTLSTPELITLMFFHDATPSRDPASFSARMTARRDLLNSLIPSPAAPPHRAG
jgi:hypothetical protein